MADNILVGGGPQEPENIVPTDGKPPRGANPPPFVSKPVSLKPPIVSEPVDLQPPIVSEPIDLKPPLRTFEDYMREFPDFKDFMNMSIAMEVVQKMKRDREREKKMKKVYDQDA